MADFLQHLPLATAQTGIDLNLFKFLAENPESEFATGELAQITGADPILLCKSQADLLGMGLRSVLTFVI